MTDRLRPRPLSVIGAPSSAGAYGPGQERAPDALRTHGLIDSLRASGVEVVDRGNGTTITWRTDEEHPEAANAGLVASAARTVADSVADAFTEGHDVLVLGGDCTLELGTVAGAISADPDDRVALVYIDLDVDLNTPETGDGILDWMGVAHLLDVDGAHQDLVSLAQRRPMLEPVAVRLVAAANITPPEQATIDALGVQVEPLEAVVRDPGEVVARTQTWAQEYDRLLVHVDIDVLDYDKFPIAENTGRRGGLELAQLTALLRELCALPNWRALTLTEVNPGHAPDESRSLRQLVAMLVDAIAPRARQ
jgi:arginase